MKAIGRFAYRVALAFVEHGRVRLHGLSGKPADCRRDDGSERQDVFVNGDEIDNIAWHSTACGC
jgi:hypothetical protein